jgi:hypothetical protein
MSAASMPSSRRSVEWNAVDMDQVLLKGGVGQWVSTHVQGKKPTYYFPEYTSSHDQVCPSFLRENSRSCHARQPRLHCIHVIAFPKVDVEFLEFEVRFFVMHTSLIPLIPPQTLPRHKTGTRND